MNSFAPIIDPNALVFMAGCMVCIAISQKFGASTFLLIAELIVPMGIVATLMSVITMLGAEKNPAAIYPSISLALLPAAYAILIKGVLSIATDLPRPSESQLALGGLGCLLFISLTLWTAYDVGAFIDIPSIIYISLSMSTVIVMALWGHQPLLATLYRHLSGIGLLGFLIGHIIALQALEEITAVGPAYAIAYLSMFYALILKVLLGILLPTIDTQEDAVPQESLAGNPWLILMSVFWSLALLISIF
ncbi:hypothetical protein N9R09_03370 [Porticoccaceae bacterium]|nr:hypothetical protein [Porticoccaceae bacterium]